MGKKGRNIYDLSGVDPIKTLSQHVTKNGKIVGSKKEKQAMRSICEHHVISKKGKKVKAKLNIHGKQCECEICKDRFPTTFYSDQDYDKAYQPYKAVLSQGKFMAASTNADMKTQQEICELNYRADRFKKVYQNLRKVAEKKDRIDKKKNEKKNGGRSAFDVWHVGK